MARGDSDIEEGPGRAPLSPAVIRGGSQLFPLCLRDALDSKETRY